MFTSSLKDPGKDTGTALLPSNRALVFPVTSPAQVPTWSPLLLPGKLQGFQEPAPGTRDRDQYMFSINSQGHSSK